jgi:8-oxo-dGTP diphosphatase
MIAHYIEKPLMGILVVLLVFSLTQRRHLEHGERKRFAILGLSGLVLLLYAAALAIKRYPLEDYFLVFPILAVVVLALRFDKSLFIFRFHCSECNSPLPIVVTLYHDDNLCPRCRGKEDHVENHTGVRRDVTDIDWASWVPDQKAALCLIIRDHEVLLIRKKTGLGAGKINMPGGRLEDGETAAEAVVRECREEVGITPIKPEKRVDLSFEFADGLSLHCSAFFAYAHSGEAVETDEADPFWCDIGSIPFSEMWEDDALWIPRAMRGEHLKGVFIFDGDDMLSKDIQTVESFD